jgi:hypothetical protein
MGGSNDGGHEGFGADRGGYPSYSGFGAGPLGKFLKLQVREIKGVLARFGGKINTQQYAGSSVQYMNTCFSGKGICCCCYNHLCYSSTAIHCSNRMLSLYNTHRFNEICVGDPSAPQEQAGVQTP